MSALRNVEDTIGGFVERVFGRLFRGHVEPVELARKLAREMEDHKTVSVSRVYVPNEYVIYLSTADRNRFASFEGALTTELGVYVSERARHEGFTLLSTPKVTLEADTDLRVGEYGIACRVADPPVESPAEIDAATPDPPAIPAPFPPPVVPLATPAASHGADAPETVHATADSDADADVDPFEMPAGADVPEGVIADELPATGSQPLDADDVAAAETPADEAEDADDLQADERVESPADAAEAPQEPAPEPQVVQEPAGTVSEPEPVVATPPASEPPVAPPEPEPEDHVAPTPEPHAQPEPVAAAPPPPIVPPVPEPPVATPLPPPGGYEPLAGVSGTQIFSAADARAEGLVQEEMALILGGARHPISKRSTSLGRSRECDIVVEDSNASRHHAEIRHIGLDYFIVDAGSTNGTLVNGQRVRRHALAHGDRITIGTTELVVEHAT